MKSIKKLFLGAAIFAAVVGFVGCKMGASGPSAIAEYDYDGKIEGSGGGAKGVVKFFGDETAALEFSTPQMIAMKFTRPYKGDPKKDKTVEIEWQKAYMPGYDGKLTDVSFTYSMLLTKYTYKISGNKISEDSSDGDSGGAAGKTVVAEYTYSYCYLRFFDNQTVSYGAQVAGQSSEFSGTYTGNPTKDGKVKIKFDATSGLPSGELEATISGKKLTFNGMTYTKKNAEDISDDSSSTGGNGNTGDWNSPSGSNGNNTNGSSSDNNTGTNGKTLIKKYYWTEANYDYAISFFDDNTVEMVSTVRSISSIPFKETGFYTGNSKSGIVNVTIIKAFSGSTEIQNFICYTRTFEIYNGSISPKSSNENTGNQGGSNSGGDSGNGSENTLAA